MTEGSVVTFYSYKGGVGRTLALANVGALLCRWGYKVLCVDWDLEAPGLHLYFEKWINPASTPDASNSRPGLTELIQAHVDGQQPKWRDFVTEAHFPKAKQPLLLMTAGRPDQSYVRRVQALDWKRLYEEHQLGNFLEALRTEWKEAFDFVLIDSRTGITDIGGICTVQLPDLLVLLFTANMQSLCGSIDVVKRARQTRHSLPFDRAKLLVLPIATRFEIRVEYELSQQWLKTFAMELGPLYDEWAHKDVTAEDLLNHTRVPYIPYWSFGEKLPVIEKGTDDPEDIGFSLETLAALVAQKFSHSDVLARNRDSFVTAVRRSGSSGARGAKSGNAAKVFISYSHKDEEYLDLLEKHLKPLQRQGIIETLDDRRIEAGEEWMEEIARNLDEADVILLLISPDYLASDFLYDIEMRRALQQHESGAATVLPVILRPVSWENSPIAILQALPRDGRPVTSWPNVDEPSAQIVRKVRELANSITRSKGLTRTK
jgi:cellulose biosynthesis protein BcsQ